MSQMEPDDAPWLTAGATARVLALLNDGGEEARVVGGAVRNALLKIPIGDIDVATTAVPDEVIRRAKTAGIKSVPTGIDHGTVTLVIDGQPVEVTTLREDTETFGRKAKVAFGRDWVGDARRRDFTINALSIGTDGVVHDYVGGLADIAARRVRFIGNPAERIAEDYLRILRFFRFHAAFSAGDVDRAGLLACIAAREGLATLSAERLRVEMLKLLVADGAVAAIAAMADGGLLLPVLGGVAYLGPFAAMIAAERRLALQPDPVRRLAALAVAVTETPSGWRCACGCPMRRPRRSIPWAIAGGGLVAWTRRPPSAGSIVSARSAIATACCWPLRAQGPMPIRPPGSNSPRCHSAGARQNFRSRRPISSHAVWPKAPRSGTC